MDLKQAWKKKVLSAAAGLEPAELVLKNASFVNVFTSKVQTADIAICCGVIAGIGSYHGLQELDMTGKVVVPGLIDAHCHVGMFEDSLGFEGDDGNEDSDPIMPHLRAIDGINPFDRGFKDAYNAGVTTVVTGPGSANPVGGQFAAVKTYGICVDDMIIKTPVAMKFALGENPKCVYNEKDEAPVTRMGTMALIRELLIKIKRLYESA